MRGVEIESRDSLERDGGDPEFRCGRIKVSSALDIRLGQGGSWINETDAQRRSLGSS